jgi:N-acetylmuramoyl-L-alanine amidase
MKPVGRHANELVASARAWVRLPALALLLAVPPPAAAAEASRAAMDELLRDPSQEQWTGLSRFDLTLTRQDFERRLDGVLDPGHGLRRYFDFVPGAVAIYPTADRNAAPAALVRFAPNPRTVRRLPVSFRPPGEPRGRPAAPGRPLAGLRVAIEPADIGGRWAKMEDRSVEFPGYGRINEGDLNLMVGRLLRDRLATLGAEVFLVRDRAEPQLAPRPADLGAVAAEVLSDRPWLMPDSFQHLAGTLPPSDPRRLRIAEGLLLTKTLETRARAALVRRLFHPDVTIVLQHNATAESTSGRLNATNRNIFFVHGAYSPSELSEPEQRFRLLTKLFEDTVRVEARVADAIALRFRAATGFPPVLSGDSANTRLVLPKDPYVVARNLAFNREHDGPVVVTEPYFMNQAETLARLLEGDYVGERRVAGRYRGSIYREYADCVAEGLVDAYRLAGPAVATGASVAEKRVNP